MHNQRVLICGASIAGSALAYWLRRHGFVPTVVERAPALREGGYKVDIRGAALGVVERMGLLDEIRRLRTDVRGGSVVDATGRRVASMDGDTFGGRQHQDAEILRGDLNRLLHELVRDDVEHVFGDWVTTMTDGPDGVEVTFASGRTRQFDLVVGADGLHSSTRRLAFGPEEQFLHHLGYHVSIYTVPNHLRLDRWELTYVGPGRTTLVYSTAGDTDARAMFLWATVRQADQHDQAAQRRQLVEAYAGEGWEVPRLLDALPTAPDFYLDSLSQVRMDHWSTGRVALVGDAAWCASPASGQGTSMALVGAYVLAGELAAAGGRLVGGDRVPHVERAHEAAFAAYEQRMRPYVARNQQLGPDNIRRMVLRSRGQVRFSMWMLGLMSRLPGRERLLAALVAPIHRAANAITLVDY